MRRTGNVPATRSGLVKARRRLSQVRRGAGLLKRKREALVGELFRLAGPASDARALIQEAAARAYPALLAAQSLHASDQLRSLGWPSREINVEIRFGRVWGIPVSEILDVPQVRRSLSTRGTAPGSTGPAATDAADQFEALLSLLIEAAPREMLIQRLGEALAATSRQINVIEQQVEPHLVDRIVRIRERLEERSREERLRQRHIRRTRSSRTSH